LNRKVTLFTKTKVIKIALNTKEDRVSSIKCKRPDGTFLNINAKVIVLACNGIGTPRLLLANTSKRFPQGLANSNDLVGRNLMLHPLAYIEGTVKEDIKSSHGPQGCCIVSQEFFATSPKNSFVRGCTLQVLRSPDLVECAKRGIRNGSIRFGATFHTDLMKAYNRTICLSFIVEDLPEATNRVSLSKRTDNVGVPLPQVHYRIGKNSREIMKFAIARGMELLESIGAECTSSFAPVGNAGWHLMGTARMGNDSSTSVTNKFGQTHEIDNLFIADSSLFVTSSSVNPASTIGALAMYVADQVKNYLDSSK